MEQPIRDSQFINLYSNSLANDMMEIIKGVGMENADYTYKPHHYAVSQLLYYMGVFNTHNAREAYRLFTGEDLDVTDPTKVAVGIAAEETWKRLVDSV